MGSSIKVLRTIARMYQTYKPMRFFGILAAVLAALSVLFVIPIIVDYTQTGLVPHFPTLIVCGFTMLAAMQSFFSGLILKTMGQKNRQDFELALQTIRIHRDELLGDERKNESIHLSEVRLDSGSIKKKKRGML